MRAEIIRSLIGESVLGFFCIDRDNFLQKHSKCAELCRILLFIGENISHLLCSDFRRYKQYGNSFCAMHTVGLKALLQRGTQSFELFQEIITTKHS